jgi:short-subunit dehydrogenase
MAFPCDVTVADEAGALIDVTVREFGRLDILVNNAGRGHFASVEDTTDEMIRNMFALNVFSLWYTTRPALRQMKRQGSGHVINVASMAGKLGYPYNSAYVAAKHACVGFTLALRMELLETDIHASVVCPAGVLTDWASVTEGGSMLPFFSASGPIIKKIASERGIALPPIEGLKSADAVAQKIIECIENPVAEVYTHRGAKEFVMLSAGNREAAELHQLPVVLGEREVYEDMMKQMKNEK